MAQPEQRTVVSVTPHGIERDSRTFKHAASLARAGYHSVVVEGIPSQMPREGLPFELVSVGDPLPTEVDAGADATPREVSGPARRGGVRAFLQRLAEPPLALAAHLRWNLRTLRGLPRANLYYLHSYNQFVAVYLKARRTGAPYIYDAHDSYFEEDPALDTMFQNRLTRRMFEGIERFAARHAAELTTVSDGVAGLLEARFGRRPRVIRNCPDLRLDQDSAGDVRSAAGVPADAFLMVSVGNAKPGDTIDEALTAMELLPDSVHLAFVGGGYERHAGLASRRGLESRVHFLPPVVPTQVTSFISSADAAPILYRAFTVNFLNALPNRFFHAIAAGLPVLCPPLVEMRALTSEYGLGLEVEPTDPDSIARDVRRLAADPELVARLRANVERARETLNWEHEEGAIAEVVASALERRA